MEGKGKRARPNMEKQTYGNNQGVGMQTRHTRMHPWNKSKQHGAT